MTKLLKSSVLALALALGSSTYAHAECVTLVHGGTFEQILEWLFPWLASHSQPSGGKPGTPPPPPPKNVAPEVDPGMAVSTLLLIGGTLTVMRIRRSGHPETY
jgi:hypothetical protein